MPPFQDEYVVCPRCESKIKMLVIEGDPGYIIGADPDGTPKLLPVQGSSQAHPSTLPEAEREKIVADIRADLARRNNMALPSEQIFLIDSSGATLDLDALVETLRSQPERILADDEIGFVAYVERSRSL